jgi:hypothetical protein
MIKPKSAIKARANQRGFHIVELLFPVTELARFAESRGVDPYHVRRLKSRSVRLGAHHEPIECASLRVTTEGYYLEECI